MAIYFSATTCSFYDTNIISVSQMPEDKVAVSDSKYKELLDKQNAGYVIIAGPDGNPTVLQQTCGKCDCLALDDYVTKHKAETITGAKTFSVSPQAPTPDESSDDTTVATTAFVNAKTKTDSDNIVHKTGNETIGGSKKFTSAIQIGAISANDSHEEVRFADDSGQRVGVLRATNGASGGRRIEMFSAKADGTRGSGIAVSIDADGNEYHTAKTPDATSNTNHIATTAWVNAKFLLSPAGLVAPFAGKTAPSGWLKCDGSAVSRTTYAALFAAIGTLYGAGDGSTTFNLPNLIGYLPLGMDGDYVGKTTIGALPNITGFFGSTVFCSAYNTSNPSMFGNGAFSLQDRASLYNEYGHIAQSQGANKPAYGYEFNAARSSAIYSSNTWYNGTRVIPASVGMNYCIKY